MNELIAATNDAYSLSNFKAGLKTGFYDLQNSMSWFREALAEIGGFHRDLVLMYIETQILLLLPIAPHIADYVWSNVLQKPTSIHDARFPRGSGPIDASIHDAFAYVKSLKDQVRQAEAVQQRKKRRGRESDFDPTQPKRLYIYWTPTYPQWQSKYVALLRELYDEPTNSVDEKQLQKRGIALGNKEEMKKAMPFLQSVKASLLRRGEGISASQILDRTLLFSELETLESAVPYIEKICAISEVHLIEVDPNERGVGWTDSRRTRVSVEANIETAMPGAPVLLVENI